MKLILPIKQVLEPVRNIFNALGELKEVRRIERKKIVTVNLVEKTGVIYPVKGKLDVSEYFLYLPQYSRIFFLDREHYTNKLKRVFYVSSHYHRTLDLNAPLGPRGKLTITIPNTEKWKKFQTKKNPALYKTIDLSAQDLELTLDLNAKDSEKAKSFSIEACKVMVTKMLEVFDDTPRRTIIIVLIFGVLIGMVLAFSFIFGLFTWMGMMG